MFVDYFDKTRSYLGEYIPTGGIIFFSTPLYIKIY